MTEECRVGRLAANRRKGTFHSPEEWLLSVASGFGHSLANTISENGAIFYQWASKEPVQFRAYKSLYIPLISTRDHYCFTSNGDFKKSVLTTSGTGKKRAVGVF